VLIQWARSVPRGLTSLAIKFERAHNLLHRHESEITKATSSD
jgi:hypothetical protein